MKEKQKFHSKTRNLSYNELKLQAYMIDVNSNNSIVETLVDMRSSRARGIAQNFAPSSQVTECPMG